MSAFWDAINAGHARNGAGRRGEARAEFERAVSLAGNDDEKGDALLQIGWTYCGDGNHLQGAATFEKILPLYNCDPHKKSMGQLHAGHCFNHGQRPAEARGAFEKVATIAGGNPWHKSGALISIGHLTAGEGRQRYKEARAIFERVSKMDDAHPHNVSDAMNMIGNVFWWDSADRYYREARSWWEKAVAFPGGHPHHQSGAQLMIGHTYRHEGNYPAAIEEFRKVEAMEFGHPHHKSDAQLHIGITCQELQNNDRAREELSKVALIKSAHQDHVRNAQNRLGQIQG